LRLSVVVSVTLWLNGASYDTIRYDTIEEFNVDLKAEYSALSSTRNQKKKLKQTTPGIRATMEERICERDEF